MVEPHATRGNTLEGMTSPHRGRGPTDSDRGGGAGAFAAHAGHWDSLVTVYVLHDQLLGADLPPYKLSLDQVRVGVGGHELGCRVGWGLAAVRPGGEYAHGRCRLWCKQHTCH